MNNFDSLKKRTFDTVTKVMGYDATWNDGIEVLTARVGFYDPSEKIELSGIDSWNPDQPFMEYRFEFFEGLKESVDTGAINFVTIEGKGYFSVSEVKTKYDGDTFVARLIPQI